MDAEGVSTAKNTISSNSFPSALNPANPLTFKRISDTTGTAINLKKVIKDTDTVLSGAEFELREGDKPLYFVEDKNDADELIGYHVVPKGTTGATTTIVAGEVTIRGLKNGTYSLVEIKAPQGYNLLDKAESVVISNANKADIVTVENSKGIQLPSTGGIGTTIFYAAGIVVMAGAVFFVVRSRKHD